MNEISIIIMKYVVLWGMRVERKLRLIENCFKEEELIFNAENIECFLLDKVVVRKTEM